MTTKNTIQNDEDWVELEVTFPEIVQFQEAGQSLTGYLYEIKTIPTSVGPSEIGVIMQTDGELKSFFISAGLKNLIKPELVGHLIKVVYEGLQQSPTSNRNFHKYRVLVKSGDGVAPDMLSKGSQATLNRLAKNNPAF